MVAAVRAPLLKDPLEATIVDWQAVALNLDLVTTTTAGSNTLSACLKGNYKTNEKAAMYGWSQTLLKN